MSRMLSMRLFSPNEKLKVAATLSFAVHESAGRDALAAHQFGRA
jgi:hypothetical protein